MEITVLWIAKSGYDRTFIYFAEPVWDEQKKYFKGMGVYFDEEDFPEFTPLLIGEKRKFVLQGSGVVFC